MTGIVDHPQFDPEVEALLREIAEDPRSNLLRVPRPMASRALVEDVPIVSVATAGLTKAERHLAIVHREELSYLLRCAAWKRLTEGEDTWFVVSRSLPDGTEVPVPSLDSVRRDARALIDDPPPDVSQLGAMELIERCVSSPLEAWPTVQQFASASLRIAPSCKARVNAAAAEIAFRRPMSALQALSYCAPRIQSTSEWVSWWTARARAFSVMGRTADAMVCHERAADAMPGHFAIMVALTIDDLLIGTEADIRRRLRMFDDAAAGTNPAVGLEFTRLRTDRQRGPTRFQPEKIRLAKRLVPELSHLGRQVVDAIL